ncbi:MULTISPECIES: helix-turn-helix domain-containing protein [unclassified Rhizobacter]|uniref:AraC family transcriptional regulator n=1 Tax=unclassified Rhizobacter TaxID=2640088 RepID=UPI0006F99BB0|nr:MULTISPECIES: helix-turn-helix domain-containing protein [unclassified Rhizobacter]KQU80859.1 AraC family transcriptional regulator [Rhizobacter sp. Root29]KQW04402.1 AraC family transcriptional regulator [Rhizobacter sp. Root1238]KRB14467.1 AraC family transcriptional regulator [Rhizobacter sp. Root16D2]
MAQRLFLRLDEDPVQGPESGTPAASLQVLPLPAALRPFVAQMLLYRERFAPGTEVVERVIPDGAVRLVVQWGDAPAAGPDARRTLLAIGPSTTPAVLRLSGRMAGLAITLRHGAAATLLGLPVGEIAGLALPLQSLWPRAGGEALSALGDLEDDASRVRVVQQALLQRLRHVSITEHRPAVQALRLLMQAGGRLPVPALAAAVGLGERRLQQLFDAQFGLSPRRWSRLARLHRCLRELRAQPQRSWAEVALDGGFFDQSHLANEFRALCGCTPAEYRRLAIAESSKTAA